MEDSKNEDLAKAGKDTHAKNKSGEDQAKIDGEGQSEDNKKGMYTEDQVQFRNDNLDHKKEEVYPYVPRLPQQVTKC